MTAEPFDAIVLAGGSATRMGGVDKPAIEVGGRSMLDTALAAVAAARTTVVVGPPRPDLAPQLRQIQESPRGAGPVAALAAGLRAAGGSRTVAVLAADLPELTTATIALLRAALDADPERGAALAVDESGRVQFLLGVWRTDVLTDTLATLDGLTNQPMKSLVPPTFTPVRMTGIADCDTEQDVAAARARATRTPMTVDAARAAVFAAVESLPAFPQAPLAAIGGALAQSLRAEAALPRIPTSAMDGYAVSGDGPWLLDTAVRVAGSSDEVVLDPGHAVRIATGAHLPAGADAVVRDEHVGVERTTNGTAVVHRTPDAPVRDDTRHPGEDWLAGSLLATPGTTVTPALASLALSAEVPDLLIRGPVRGHVVVTGDEIRRDGPLRDGQTRDSLGPVLPAFLSRCGVRTSGDTHLRDTAGGFGELLGRGRTVVDADLLVIVGATGGGAADHLRDALDRAGARVVVGRVRCRPGGSQIVATLPDGRIVLGLPGNPYAAVAALLLMVPTIVAALTGAPRPVPTVGAVENAAVIDSDVTRLVPVTRESDGRWHANAQVRTAHLGALVRAQAIAVITPGTPDGGPAELLSLPH